MAEAPRQPGDVYGAFENHLRPIKGLEVMYTHFYSLLSRG